jgi:curved DNA-binding protein CbpA
MRTHYENLKVAENAPDEVIKAAYRALCQKYHPDKNSGDAEAHRIMQIINAAYAVLSDAAQRSRYDESLRVRRQREAADARKSAPPPVNRSAPPPASPPSRRRPRDMKMFGRMHERIRSRLPPRGMRRLVQIPIPTACWDGSPPL